MFLDSHLRGRWWQLAWWFAGCLTAVLCGANTAVSAAPAQAAAVASDVLVYADGDRVRGRLVAREGDVIVFRSERFGELRVPATAAQVISGNVAAAPKPATSGSAPPPPPAAAPAPAPAETPVSTSAFQRLAHAVFSSWHGRISFSASAMQDTYDRSDFAIIGRLERKWRRDEVRLEGRYDFSRRNQITTADRLTTNGYWRRDLPQRWFALYRPLLESNHSFVRLGRPADYILLQNELGAGRTVVSERLLRLRLGAGENMVDNWSLVQNDHAAEHFESLFSELELDLPGRIRLTNRAAWYPLFAQGSSWENQFELSKKLAHALNLGVRHEVRYNAPDVRTQDYSLWRFVMGYDF
ncbi:MAG: DUF481 domain-containing protein [Opitutae bacterium]|nr:DUF481 domain-containing protein [Opitutae bacterium]